MRRSYCPNGVTLDSQCRAYQPRLLARPLLIAVHTLTRISMRGARLIAGAPAGEYQNAINQSRPTFSRWGPFARRNVSLRPTSSSHVVTASCGEVARRDAAAKGGAEKRERAGKTDEGRNRATLGRVSDNALTLPAAPASSRACAPSEETPLSHDSMPPTTVTGFLSNLFFASSLFLSLFPLFFYFSLPFFARARSRSEIGIILPEP